MPFYLENRFASLIIGIIGIRRYTFKIWISISISGEVKDFLHHTLLVLILVQNFDLKYYHSCLEYFDYLDYLDFECVEQNEEFDRRPAEFEQLGK